MKHLANCTPTEFFTQAVKVRAPFAAWLESTGIPAIRARKPEGFDQLTDAEKVDALRKQGEANMTDILISALEKDPQGTLGVMALCCFTDPQDVDSHPITEYLTAVLEMFSSESVRSFFTLYLRPTTTPSSRP